MNCRRVVSLMSAYVDGELTGAEMLEIRRHLGDCTDCTEEYESIRLVKQMLFRLDAVKPRQDLAASILTTLDAVEVPRYQKIINSVVNLMHQKLSPVAAALAVSGFALVIMSAGGVNDVSMKSGQEMAMSQYGAYTSGVKYSPNISANSYILTDQPQPLIVKDNVSELTHSDLKFASIR
ncbi:zf-HC2 domain-containing protein [bacterium]|nr:zf-HC2 domain-containing protein [bacterium]